MYGAEKDLVGQFHKGSEKNRYVKPMVVHCTIHEQELCRKYLLYHVIKTEVLTVYFICSHGFIRC